MADNTPLVALLPNGAVPCCPPMSATVSPSSFDRPAHRMTGDERRATQSLAGIFALRMLGLFLVLPVFML